MKWIYKNACTPVQNWRHPKRDYDPISQLMTSNCNYKGNQTLKKKKKRVTPFFFWATSDSQHVLSLAHGEKKCLWIFEHGFKILSASPREWKWYVGVLIRSHSLSGHRLHVFTTCRHTLDVLLTGGGSHVTATSCLPGRLPGSTWKMSGQLGADLTRPETYCPGSIGTWTKGLRKGPCPRFFLLELDTFLFPFSQFSVSP